jgi:hypothetical protein
MGVAFGARRRLNNALAGRTRDASRGRNVRQKGTVVATTTSEPFHS